MATRAKKKADPPEQHPDDTLDAFVTQATENQWNAIALLLWKDRHRNPDFAVPITRQDLEGFSACLGYLDVQPKLRIYRPGHVPARHAIPATDTRSAIPASPETPPKDYVLIQMTDTAGNAIKPVENNVEDHAKGEATRALFLARRTANAFAQDLEAQVNNQTISNATVLEAAKLIRTLAANP